MSSPEVLPKPNLSTGSSYESDSDEDDFSGAHSKPLSTIKTYDGDSSIAKLPGTALLRSVSKRQVPNLSNSNHESIKSLKSDHTYDFDKKDSGDSCHEYDEFGEDSASPVRVMRKKLDPSSASSSSPAPKPPLGGSARVPAWKLRQQAMNQKTVPPAPPPKIFPNGGTSPKVSPLRTARKNAQKTRSASNKPNGSSSSSTDPQQSEAGWFKKLTTKKETPEEREKRLKNEALIQKQVPDRWGKDILEEDDSEEADDADEVENEILPATDQEKEPEKDEEESDTVKRVKSLIEKSFGSALVSITQKDKDAEGRDEGDEEETTTSDATPKASGPPNRGNRWAMMGSAAMTSMRNIQKGLMSDEKDNDKDSSPKKQQDTIAEGDSEEEGEGGDKVADIGSNRRANMWRNRGAVAFTSVRNAWGGGAAARRRELENADESSSHADDGLDSKSVHSDPGRLDQGSSKDDDNHPNNNKLLSSIGNFLQHTRARFDPEVWADPEIQESVAAIEELRTKLHECRHLHKTETRRRERQIENSISQQKNFLARKLARQMYGYKSHPFHPCIKDVYQKEILIIVHEATSLGGDEDSQLEKDGIDDLLDSKKFDFDYLPEETESTKSEGLGSFFGLNAPKNGDKNKRGENSSQAGSLFSGDGSVLGKGTANKDAVVPLQTRLIRAQHNGWMTDHQMELERAFQQKSVEHLYDLLPELRKDHEKIKAIPQSAVDAKAKEMEEANKKLKEAYQAHLEAQEKLLAIYRERYVPSVHEEETENNEETKEKSETNAEEEDAFDAAPSSPNKSPPKRPSMWARNMSESFRGLFGPKKEETEDDKAGEGKNEGDDGKDDDDGFELSSPITEGSLSKSKFILSFGSPDGSNAASGILANFSVPTLDNDEKPSKEGTEEKATQQESSAQEFAQEQALAAWTVPKMDKGSLPETLAEKRAKRAAARRANRPDAVAAATNSTSTTSRKTAANGSSTSTSESTSRSELLRRARKAREESAAALGSSASGKLSADPSSPTPSSRTGRSSLRSNTSSSRKELSMKDLMAAAGDSRRKIMENDSRMERLSYKKNQLSKASTLSSPTGTSASVTSSRLSEERRLRVMRKLRQDSESMDLSSHHSLHERKSRTGRSLKSASKFDEDESEDPVNENLEDVDEFGETR